MWAHLARGSGQLALGTNAFCNRGYCPSFVGLCTSGCNWDGGGQSELSNNAFCNRSYCPGVVGLCTGGCDEWGVNWY